MTPKEAFFVGFLSRCVDDGLTVEQMGERVKQAEDLLGGMLKGAGVLGDLAGAAGGVASTALPLALALPPLVGGLGGYTLARMGDIDDTDVDDIRKQELKDTYHLEAQRLRRQKAFRDARRSSQQRVRGYYG